MNKKRQERLGHRKIDERRLITSGKRYNYGVNKSNQINLEGWCKIKTVHYFSLPEQFLKIC